jgi:hypothetical protein
MHGAECVQILDAFARDVIAKRRVDILNAYRQPRDPVLLLRRRKSRRRQDLTVSR